MKLTGLAAALAVSTTAVLAAPSSESPNSLEARAEAYKDGLKVLCPKGPSSITWEDNRFTACCGDCCECVVCKSPWGLDYSWESWESWEPRSESCFF